MDEQNPESQDQVLDEKTLLTDKYRAKNCQTISYKEYLALQEKKQARKKVSLPLQIKFILGTPLFILFGYGVIFIPWIIYLILTSKPAPAPGTDQNRTTMNTDTAGSSAVSR